MEDFKRCEDFGEVLENEKLLFPSDTITLTGQRVFIEMNKVDYYDFREKEGKLLKPVGFKYAPLSEVDHVVLNNSKPLMGIFWIGGVGLVCLYFGWLLVLAALFVIGLLIWKLGQSDYFTIRFKDNTVVEIRSMKRDQLEALRKAFESQGIRIAEF